MSTSSSTSDELKTGRPPRHHTHDEAGRAGARPVTLAGHPGVRALRHRNYRLFFTGQLISLIGTWTQQVAEAWLVLQLTHDPLWLGIVSLAQFGPVILFGLFGGVIADQLPKRRTLIVTQSVAMTLAFILFGLSVTGADPGLAHPDHRDDPRLLELDRHADAPVVRGRDGRPGRRGQRRRAELRALQHGPDRRSGRRRDPDRGVRHPDRLPDQRVQLHRRDRRLLA